MRYPHRTCIMKSGMAHQNPAFQVPQVILCCEKSKPARGLLGVPRTVEQRVATLQIPILFAPNEVSQSKHSLRFGRMTDFTRSKQVTQLQQISCDFDPAGSPVEPFFLTSQLVDAGQNPIFWPPGMVHHAHTTTVGSI